ncbi:MAG: hypothetical protein LBH13_04850 [Cellulomonadaceae bacterium]|jgi:hypothetical protein|nr:hypothetical protein [Cellulomonadaceae bacterium]
MSRLSFTPSHRTLRLGSIALALGLAVGGLTAAPASAASPLTGCKATITGQATVGLVLTATPKKCSPNPTRYTYQWLRDGKKISKATKVTYKVTSKDAGTKLAVKITAKKSGYAATTKTSPTKKAGAVTAKMKDAEADAQALYRAYPLSRSYTIKTLKEGGYTTAQATYGTDILHKNQNAQAKAMAKYLISQDVQSRVSTIVALKELKFTPAQAVYGADHASANWNAQAVLAAKLILSQAPAATRAQVIEGLTMPKIGFTSAQATYAANKLGL